MESPFSAEQVAFLLEFEPPKNCVLVTIWLNGALPSGFLKTVFSEKEAAFLAAKKEPKADQNRAVYMAERAHFLKIADALEVQKEGPDWLWQLGPSRIVAEKLREMNGPFFRLHAFSILPNGAHFLVDFETQLADNQRVIDSKFAGLVPSLRLLKGSTSQMLAAAAGQKVEHFWATPHTERRIERAEHFFAAIDFVLQSPVRAELCEHWREHDGSWAEPLFLRLG